MPRHGSIDIVAQASQRQGNPNHDGVWRERMKIMRGGKEGLQPLSPRENSQRPALPFEPMD